eukprot:scpid69846/ scgid8532/ Inositol polyphosphate 5-phosphatase K; Skeletal muscle and kidney-enriched inositol phosphatase
MAGIGATERSWLRIWSGTWNVYSVGPADDLTDWLGLKGQSDVCDVYAVGFQEANASPVAWTSELMAFDPWTQALSSLLCKYGLTRLFVRRVFGLLICVFVRVELLPHISDIEFSKLRTSMTGKGAIAVRFRICGLHAVFINCHFFFSHFCPHTENISVRNKEYFRAIKQMRFSDAECTELLQHHYIIWMGDFNYRLDQCNVEFVKTALQQSRLGDLRQYDQLTREKDLGYVYSDFNEGILDFPPTYKFTPKTHDYDYSNPRRLPSWCDRIQWKVVPRELSAAVATPAPSSATASSSTANVADGAAETHERHQPAAHVGVRPALQLLSYRSHHTYTVSDHKPVSGLWLMAVPALSTCLPPVLFTTPRVWTFDTAATIEYEVQESVETSNWDWIALCKEGWQWHKDYVTYVWAPANATTGKRRTSRSVVLEERYLPKQIGMYQLVYYSAENDNAVLGVSRLFLITSGLATPSSSSSRRSSSRHSGSRRSINVDTFDIQQYADASQSSSNASTPPGLAPAASNVGFP